MNKLEVRYELKKRKTKDENIFNTLYYISNNHFM